MNLIENTRDLASQIVSDLRYVHIHPETIKGIAKRVKKWNEGREGNLLLGLPKCISPEDPDRIQKVILYELIASSVNYCYWFSRFDIRPNGASATRIFELLDEIFLELEVMKKSAMFAKKDELRIVIRSFETRLSKERFPLLGLRIQHLEELLNQSDLLSVVEMCAAEGGYDVESWLEYIVTVFPGFSRDLFLKRAFLFILQLNRRMGFFEEEIVNVPVPTDYQVPKMLRHFNCLTYSSELALKIYNGELIPEGSRMETEIRAATLVACDILAHHAECAPNDVDFYLWSNRNECGDPFHLTMTSNY